MSDSTKNITMSSFSVKFFLVVLIVGVATQKRVRQIFDEPPFDYHIDDVPQFWWDQRNDTVALSCLHNRDPLLPYDDLLFRTRDFQRQAVGISPPKLEHDWKVRMQHSNVEEHFQQELVHRHNYVHSHWLNLRPFQHSFFNLWQHEQDLENVYCPLGFITCVWVAGVQSILTYPGVYPVEGFATLWPIMWEVWSLADWLLSGWGEVLFMTLSLLMARRETTSSDVPLDLFLDCPIAGNIFHPDHEIWMYDHPNENLEDVYMQIQETTKRMLTDVDQFGKYRCPMTVAFHCVFLAEVYQAVPHVWRAWMDLAQDAFKQANFLEAVFTRWPIWHHLYLMGHVFSTVKSSDLCRLATCQQGFSPNHETCTCEAIYTNTSIDFNNISVSEQKEEKADNSYYDYFDFFSQDEKADETNQNENDNKQHNFCILMADSRLPQNIESPENYSNLKFYTFTYQVNKLYAEQFGYKLFYESPDEKLHYPDRKVGWGKVKMFIEMMQNKTNECDYGVSIDTDAYFRTSESLESLTVQHKLEPYGSNLAAFSKELHEVGDVPIYVNGGFWVVRNSDAGVQMIQDWYDVPENYPEYASWKRENPQGLNHCWDRAMHPIYKDRISLIDPRQVTCPLATFVRHNFFKEKHFEIELGEVLLTRAFLRTGCFWCDETFDILHGSDNQNLLSNKSCIV